MSTLAPGRSLRTRTSDLTDFFRGSSSSTQDGDKDIAARSTSTLEVPSDTEGAGKKKITRIPLFGRSRKKSNQSTASSPFAPSVRESADAGQRLSYAASIDRRSLGASEVPAPPPPPIPTPDLHKHASFTSKLASRFNHSRKTAVSQVTETSVPPTPPLPPTPSALAPTLPCRAASFDSGSSGGSKARSVTPRPQQPAITFSITSDPTFDDKFSGLFTPPPGASSRNSSQRTITSKPREGDATPSSSTSLPQRARAVEETMARKRGFTPASAIVAAHRQNSVEPSTKPPSTSSRRSSSRKNSESDKGNDTSSTPRDSEARDSPRQTPTPPPKDRESRSESRRPSVTSQASDAGSSSRSRLKQPSKPQSRPPSMPLPPTPPSVPSSPAQDSIPFVISDTERQISPTTATQGRARAKTLSSASRSAPSIPLPPTPTTPVHPHSVVLADIAIDSLNPDTATIEELKQAFKHLKVQNDELSSQLRDMLRSHDSEVARLEKLLRSKEHEARHWEFVAKAEQPREQNLPPGLANRSRLSPPSSYVESDPEHRRRAQYQSDSGAESNIASGSGSESVASSIRHKRFRKLLYTSDSATAASVRSSGRPSDGSHADSLIGKRTSLSSRAPSPSSSTSSLLPPSPSVTVSSLSAIPEAPRKPGTTRAANRISTSSMASSTTAASSAYSVSVKRSRPPSIAQVLEQPPPSLADKTTRQ